MNIPFWTVGRTVDLLALRPEDMTAEIVGGTLAKLNRFGGWTPEPFSVAAHSVLVEHLCPLELRPWALLHDAHEAFLGDIMIPAVWLIDRSAPEPGAIPVAIARAKGALDRAIGSAWGVAVRSMSEAVRRADGVALMAEAWEFLGWRPEPLGPAETDLLDSAMEVLRGLPAGGDWRAARDLWVARIEYHASLGRLTPPPATDPAGMVPAGQPRRRERW